MVTVRLTCIAAVGLLAGAASAAERSTAFGVTVQVATRMTFHTPAATSLGSPQQPAWPPVTAPKAGSAGVQLAGEPRSPCQPAGCATALPAGAAAAVVVTVLPDGSPTAVVGG